MQAFFPLRRINDSLLKSINLYLLVQLNHAGVNFADTFAEACCRRNDSKEALYPVLMTVCLLNCPDIRRTSHQ